MNLKDVLDCYIDNKKRFKELSEQCCNKEIVPFVGAGLSMPPYLGWADTLREILGDDNQEKMTELNALLTSHDYQAAADFVYGALHTGVFEERFREHFDKHNGVYSEGTKLLPNIFRNTAILTTNYDRCLDQAYRDAKVDFDALYPRDDKYVIETVEKLLRPTTTLIWKLHGDYKMAESRVFTSEEYNQLYNQNGECFRQINRYFSISSFLFLGCSLSETDYYISLLKGLATKSRRIKNYAFLQMPETNEEFSNKATFCSDLGIFPIWYPHDDSSHESVVILLKQLNRNVYDRKTLRRSITSETFTNKSVPEVIKSQLDCLGISIDIPDSENITLDDIIAIALSKNSKYSREGLEHALYEALGDIYDEKYLNRKNICDVRGKKSFSSRDSWTDCFNKCLEFIGVQREDYYQSKVIVVGIGNGEEGDDLEYDKIAQNINGRLCLVDIALESLLAAKRIITANGGDCRIVNQPAQNMSSVSSDSQDIYISTMTYQSTFFNIDKALYEAVRVLKPSGKIIISIVNGYLDGEGNYVRGLTKFNSKDIDQEKPRRIINHIKAKLELLGQYNIATFESDSEIFLGAYK